MSGNSWQQPVSGEFGRGTMKKHVVGLVDTDPDILVTPVDCSAVVSKGCRTVLIHVDVGSSGPVYTINFWDDSGAGAGALWSHYETDSGNADDHDQVIVGLDSDRKFYYQASHANIVALIIDLVAYWE